MILLPHGSGVSKVGHCQLQQPSDRYIQPVNRQIRLHQVCLDTVLEHLVAQSQVEQQWGAIGPEIKILITMESKH